MWAAYVVKILCRMCPVVTVFAECGQLKAAVLGYGITLPEGRLIKTFVTVMCGNWR